MALGKVDERSDSARLAQASRGDGTSVVRHEACVALQTLKRS